MFESDFRITSLDEVSIWGEADIYGGEELFLESVIRLAAYHARYLTNFEKLVYLVKVRRCNFSYPVSGKWQIYGQLLGRSAGSFLYELKAAGGGTLTGQFLLGTSPYTREMGTDMREFYRRRFFAYYR